MQFDHNRPKWSLGTTFNLDRLTQGAEKLSQFDRHRS
jgi:hypothetical protein